MTRQNSIPKSALLSPLYPRKHPKSHPPEQQLIHYDNYVNQLRLAVMKQILQAVTEDHIKKTPHHLCKKYRGNVDAIFPASRYFRAKPFDKDWHPHWKGETDEQ